MDAVSPLFTKLLYEIGPFEQKNLPKNVMTILYQISTINICMNENQNSASETDSTHFVTACYLSTLDTAKRTPKTPTY